MPVINGTINNDNLVGSSVDDIIDDGNGGNDTINGNEGNDQITVTGGNDGVTGGTGTDTLIIDWSTSISNSFMTQNPNVPTGSYSASYANNDGRSVGANTIENIQFFGGSGNDAINSGGGIDSLNGGAGDDTLGVGQGTSDSADGGANIDRLGINFIDRGAGISIDLNAVGNQLLSGSGVIANFEGFTTVSGSSFNDTIVSTNVAINETLNGGVGDDLIEVRNGSDTVVGGDGSDTLVINWSASTANSFMSQNPNVPTGTFSASYGNNDGRFVGGSGIEHIRFFGGSGSDTVNSGGGIDSLNGNAGNDVLGVGRGSSDSADGGADIDQLGINFVDRLGAVSINLNLGGNQMVAGLGTIANFEGFSSVTGSAFGDTIMSTNALINESFDGGTGDDLIEVRNGADTVVGGDGSDTLVINWSASTSTSFMSQNPSVPTGTFSASYQNNDGRFVGVSGIEHIQFFGGSGSDGVNSGGGTDSLNGGAGDDTLGVGQGISDSADGGADIDRLGISFVDRASAISINLNLAGEQLITGAGSITNFEGFSTVTGTAFNDVIRGTNAVINETLNGGNGNDLIEVRNGSDTVSGGAGNDTVLINWSASTANSFMSQNPSSPTSTFSAAYQSNDGRFVGVSTIENIQFIGGSGNDAITAAGGRDILNGNAGNDTLDVGRGSTDSANGGTETDRLGINLIDRLGAVSINLNLGGNQMVAGLGTISGFEGFATVTGSNFADTLISTDFDIDETFSGGEGDDIIDVRNGSDTVSGGNGTDTLVIDWSASTANSFMTQNPSVPTGTFSASYQNNDGRSVGVSGVEHIAFFGGTGNDTVNSAGGIDSLNGGAGDDTLGVGQGTSDSADGGANTDRLGISFIERASAISINLNLNGEQLVTGAGSITNFEGFTTVTGTSFNDTIRSTNAVINETLDGGNGNDIFEVRNGSDTVVGGAGNDTLIINWSASVGNSSMAQNPSAPTGSFSAAYQNSDGRFVGVSTIENIQFTGGSGSDGINSGGGTDILNGGAGNDTLNGGAGNDRLIGGSGSDAMTGGSGDDSYVVDESGDTVIEAANQGSADTVQAFVDFTLGANVERLEMFGNARVGTGNALTNTILGSNGRDTLSGVEGNDVLRGRGASDMLSGGTGLDILDGGAGKDTMSGGTGRDTFQFGDGDTVGLRSQADIITDFDQGADERIQLSLVDANATTGGNQDFEWIGTAAFSNTAGELRYQQGNGVTFIEGDLNGDGTSDYTIRLNGLYTLDATDFTGVNDIFP